MNRAEEFARIARQLVQERSAARSLVELVRRNPAGYLTRELPRDWMTAGMAQELTEAAYEMHQNAPEKSGALATLATRVAEELDETYPRVLRAQLRATAWKEVSNAHRFRSRYDAALHALDRAEQELATESALGFDAAVITLARAITLRDVGRLPEALALVQAAIEIFRGYGDDGRVAQCNLLIGMIRHRQGNVLAARETYRRAASTARDAGDIRTVASAYINLGVLDAEAGKCNAALDWLQQARSIFRELDAHAEVARANYGIAFALLSSSKYEAAVETLRASRTTFLSLGMPEEAGYAGVLLVEACLALHRYEVARAVIVTVIDEFRAANLNGGALVALAYLRDLGAAAPPAAARHVHNYLTRLRNEPALLFHPLD